MVLRSSIFRSRRPRAGLRRSQLSRLPPSSPGPAHPLAARPQSHTILLVQPTKRPEGRTYADYESVNECMEDIEQILRHTNPTTRTGSRRKSMSCCGDKPSNQESKWSPTLCPNKPVQLIIWKAHLKYMHSQEPSLDRRLNSATLHHNMPLVNKNLLLY
ncbi:uncharacterized protein LOC132382214 isoform X6 [Hypanus sabinus]|uniref:uncharacterized protein LOC132382214 isoform X6 n=1 Tax=Hypanus sabinus TaxID=79690 RepID=UPI0028C43BDB|nr:uncharacterized protein LOC132382214 isoform X6 [Hypanus sabinus]